MVRLSAPGRGTATGVGRSGGGGGEGTTERSGGDEGAWGTGMREPGRLILITATAVLAPLLAFAAITVAVRSNLGDPRPPMLEL